MLSKIHKDQLVNSAITLSMAVLTGVALYFVSNDIDNTLNTNILKVK